MKRELVKFGLSVTGGLAFYDYMRKVFELYNKGVSAPGLVVTIGQKIICAAAGFLGYEMSSSAINTVDQKLLVLKTAIEAKEEAEKETEEVEED